MIPVVMSGGSGTRLWPVSRTENPKQFCDLFGESLQAMTLRRLSVFGPPWIVTSETLRTQTQENLKESGVEGGELLFEPFGKNTAAAIALVCRVLELRGRAHEIVGIFPADHLITKKAEFEEALREAEKVAATGKLVTLGIHPHFPETGFGYIQTEKGSSALVRPVVQFHEKPSLEKANQFLEQGNFSWNAGIFVFRASLMAELLAKHSPEVWTEMSRLKEDLSNLQAVYKAVKSISIDYAVMEKMGGTGDLMCLPVEIGWSDVGSWDAVAEESARRPETQHPRTHLVEASDVFVHAAPQKVVSVIGVSGVRVIDTPDALLISKEGESQKVRQVVEQLAKTADPVLHRPATDRVWTIGRGEAELSINGKTEQVRAGMMVSIPAGAKVSIKTLSQEALEWSEGLLES